MRAYGYRGQGAALALDADEGHYRLRHGEDAVWPPMARAYGGPAETDRQRQIAQLVLAVVRLIVPVMLLLVLLGAAYLYADAQLPLAGLPVPFQDTGLTISDIILPGAWFCIHLTNRRYGPGYAFAQLVAALAISIVVILINPAAIDQWVITSPALTARTVLSFGASMLVSNFIGITFFDAARGPRWWTAPLAASFAVSLLFSALYYPVAFMGVTDNWIAVAATHFAAFFSTSLALLIPYWMLRATMRPIGGMNGF